MSALAEVLKNAGASIEAEDDFDAINELCIVVTLRTPRGAAGAAVRSCTTDRARRSQC